MEHRLSSCGLFFPALASGFSWMILLNMTIVSNSKPQRPEGCSVCGTRDQQAESPPGRQGRETGCFCTPDWTSVQEQLGWSMGAGAFGATEELAGGKRVTRYFSALGGA